MRGIKSKADCRITQSYRGTILLALCCVQNSTKISKIVFNHDLFWTYSFTENAMCLKR